LGLTAKCSFISKPNGSFRSFFAALILVADTFVWYLYSGKFISDITAAAGFSNSQSTIIWAINLIGTVLAIFFGFALSKRFRRLSFLRYWLLVGVVLSLLGLVMDFSVLYQSMFFFALSGVYFGLGMPVALAYFAWVTKEDNRARFGGFTFLISFIAVFLLGAIGFSGVALNAVVLAIGQALAFALIFIIKPPDQPIQKNVKYKEVFTNKTFVLYFVPWMMFAIVNYISTPIVNNIFPDLFQQSILIENLLAGVIAVATGFFADRFGRKRLVLIGFVLLGIGYASLGLFEQNLVSWWFYTIADGVSWGIFYTIFLMTIWGDIAMGKKSEKFYAIGYLPFLFSIFTELSIANEISSLIDPKAIFSFTSFFLFLAILPLTYAPETLSQKTIQNKEMQNYIKKAQRKKSRFGSS
jgi:MFS family permease